MPLGGVIYEQNPRPNPMGAAIQQAGAAIGEGYRQGKELQRTKDQQLVTMALQFLPRMADNPDMLRQFTGHKDFGNILGAFQRTGLGSVFTRSPQGSYTVNVPADQQTLEQMYASAVKKKMSGGFVEDGHVDMLLSGLSAKAYGSAAGRILAKEGADAITDEPKATDIGNDQETALSLGQFTAQETANPKVSMLPTNPMAIMLGMGGKPADAKVPSVRDAVAKKRQTTQFLTKRGEGILAERKAQKSSERKQRVGALSKALQQR